MSDDLSHLFNAATEAPADDEAFVAAVSRRIWWQRRSWMFAAAAAVGVLLLATWATWPAAYGLSVETSAGLQLIASGIRAFFDSQIGMTLAAALALSAVVWAWATGRLRNFI